MIFSKSSNEDILDKADVLLLEAKELRASAIKLVTIEQELETLAEEMYYRIRGRHTQDYYEKAEFERRRRV